ncbi:hypothetical protein Tco_0364687 [Tanacetum coccineum]
MASHRLNPRYAIKNARLSGRLNTKEVVTIGKLKDKFMFPNPLISHLCKNVDTPVDVQDDFDSNDDTSSDDDYFEDIEYVSLEEVNEVDQEEKEFDLEDILQIQDDILREKLLNEK